MNDDGAFWTFTAQMVGAIPLSRDCVPPSIEFMGSIDLDPANMDQCNSAQTPRPQMTALAVTSMPMPWRRWQLSDCPRSAGFELTMSR